MNIVHQLEDLIQQQPFRPFTLCVAGGRKHRVLHPDFIGLSPRRKTIIVWTALETAIFINPNLISEIEEHAAKGRG